MASSIICGVIIILLETNAISGQCTEQFVDAGIQNVLLDYNFGWGASETKLVRCFHEPNKIGECYFSFGLRCLLETTSIGVYNMSTNADLTVVTVTIITFNNTTLGNYSCSKDNGTSTITKCVKNKDSPATPTPKPKDWTEVCTTERVVGIIGLVLLIIDVVLLILLAKRDGWEDIRQFDWCQNQGCQPKRVIVFALSFFVLLGVCLVIYAVVDVESKSFQRCHEGWSKENDAAIGSGITGDIIMCIMVIIEGVLMCMLNQCCGTAPVNALPQELKPAPVNALSQNPKPAPVNALPQNPKPAPVNALPQNPKPAPVNALPQNPKPAPVNALPQNPKPAPVNALPQNPKPEPVNVLQQNPKPAPVNALSQNPKQASEGSLMPEQNQAHLVNDLYYGLVFSHISGFMEYALKDKNNQLLQKWEEYKKDGKHLIDGFLLVIPKTCTPMLPTKKHQSSQLQFEEKFRFRIGGNESDYAVTIFSIFIEREKYYICAQEPTVLTVISQLPRELPRELTRLIDVDSELEDFQDLYNQLLDLKGWSNTVQLVECKGEEDIADAAASFISREKGQHAVHTTHDSNRRGHSDKSMKISKSLPEGDVIPGLAWDYVHNYLMKHLNLVLRRSYLKEMKIVRESTERLIIVWVTSCNTETCWTDKANIKSGNRKVKRFKEKKNGDRDDQQSSQHLNLNIFTAKDQQDQVSKTCNFTWYFLAEYCTPMHCIKMMEEEYGMSSAFRTEQGKRFKEIFDEIISIHEIKKKLGGVSFINFDDLSDDPEKSLIDLLEKEVCTYT